MNKLIMLLILLCVFACSLPRPEHDCIMRIAAADSGHRRFIIKNTLNAGAIVVK